MAFKMQASVGHVVPPFAGAISLICEICVKMTSIFTAKAL